jgi:hypothetical protein
MSYLELMAVQLYSYVFISKSGRFCHRWIDMP